jgi:FMN phosphatase YigB (HAD superfamily)
LYAYLLLLNQIGTELPGRALFDVAIDKASSSLATAKLNAREALHCGSDYTNDIEAAATAGWQSCLIANPTAELAEQQKTGPQTLTLMSVSGLLPALGLQPLGGPVLTTRRRGQFVDGEM